MPNGVSASGDAPYGGARLRGWDSWILGAWCPLRFVSPARRSVLAGGVCVCARGVMVRPWRAVLHSSDCRLREPGLRLSLRLVVQRTAAERGEVLGNLALLCGGARVDPADAPALRVLGAATGECAVVSAAMGECMRVSAAADAAATTAVGAAGRALNTFDVLCVDAAFPMQGALDRGEFEPDALTLCSSLRVDVVGGGGGRETLVVPFHDASTVWRRYRRIAPGFVITM